MNPHEQMIEAIAHDMERDLNATSRSRIYAVDRAALSRLYAAIGSFIEVEYPEPRIARGDR